jgi:putative ABC transport system ATP-binding protein
MTDPTPPQVMLTVERLSKRYGAVAVFEDVSFQVSAGEFVAVVGDSGVGKSTLLNCVAGLDEPSGGSVQLAGVNVLRLGERERAALRRDRLGFVFQAFHVLPHLSVADNTGLPLLLQGLPAPTRQARVADMLEAVGLAGLQARMPSQLSGGQLQRVAIARALVHRPSLILADEPTGNLDPGTATQVLEVLLAQTRCEGAACVLVTHSEAAAARADRVLRLTASGIR